MCGKQVIDTSMYRMSEGGNARHAVKDDRDESSFKSSEQIAREQAQQQAAGSPAADRPGRAHADAWRA